MKRIKNVKGASVVEYCCLLSLITVTLIPAISASTEKFGEKFVWAGRVMLHGVGSDGSNCGVDGVCSSSGGHFGGGGPGGGDGASFGGEGEGAPDDPTDPPEEGGGNPGNGGGRGQGGGDFGGVGG